MKNLQKAKVEYPLLDILMEYCDEMITVKSLDLRYLDCNRAFLNHFGLKQREDVVGKSVNEIIPPINLQLIKPNLLKVIKTQTLQSYTFDIYTNNSSRTVQQISTPVIQDNRVKYILTISRDITQEEFIKEELIAKTTQLNTLMEHLPLLVYMKDKNKNYIIGSKYAKDFVENGTDPYSGNIQIAMKDAAKVTQEEDDYVLNSKEKLRKEKQAVDTDGNLHWYRIVKAPIIRKDNFVDGLVTIAKNIDNDKEIENQKDLFIATLVHDLKNPLLAQISGMELLRKGYFDSLTNEQTELLETIIESANYMKEMLYTLINTYKYDNGNIVLKKTKTDIDKLIKTCIKEHLSLAQEQEINIVYNSLLQESDKYITIDEKQIRRVITNLLNNGINYAFKHSDFVITTHVDKDKIVIKLTNSGAPIDEETRKHLFEKYISGTNKYQKVGFGLGMYLSKKVMEAHQGDIYYTGNGTLNSFIIELPIKPKNDVSKIIW